MKDDKINFNKIEKGLFEDLTKLDSEATKKLNSKYGMDQVWGVSGSFLDEDNEKFKEAILSMFQDKSAVELILSKWSYDYADLEDGTQPW